MLGTTDPPQNRSAPDPRVGGIPTRGPRHVGTRGM